MKETISLLPSFFFVNQAEVQVTAKKMILSSLSHALSLRGGGKLTELVAGGKAHDVSLVVTLGDTWGARGMPLRFFQHGTMDFRRASWINRPH